VFLLAVSFDYIHKKGKLFPSSFSSEVM